MPQNYDEIIETRAQNVFHAMEKRVSADDLVRIKQAFEFARIAHSHQKRKTGEPYILHPVAVATIAAEELGLGANPVIAAFLHDVVEDTDHTIDDIRKRFGDDVAFLVKVLTKQKKDKYEMSKQLDNFKQMLNSVQYDIRALLVKLADRLHNMRTLSSMRPDKQMKIAGETDYFYAPLANRLGLYNVKTELENLSFRFGCPVEFEQLQQQIEADRNSDREKLDSFMNRIKSVLSDHGIETEVYAEYRRPYSLWRKMRKFGDDFYHLKYRHFIEIVFDTENETAEKEMALKIYSILTDHFREKPGGISNYIDTPKENGYQSFHLKLLSDFGKWQETHLSSRRMILNSQFGCIAERSEENIKKWIEKFRIILRDIASHGHDGANFIENVVTSFYNDDIMTFTPQGKSIVLPQRATVLDFAFEVHSEVGKRAKYARINGRLASIKTRLRRGDVVEIFTAANNTVSTDWLDNTVTYKARKTIRNYLDHLPVPEYDRCTCCNPIPGEEVIGFKNEATGRITIHKRDCQVVISLASQHGDDIVSVDFNADRTLYHVKITVIAVDRYHLFSDIIRSITDDLNLSINSINTDTVDSIVTMTVTFSVHSFSDLQTITNHISKIPGVDEVKGEVV